MHKLVWQERHDEDLKWEVEAVLAWHDEDARAAIATLLLDCQHLRLQLALAEDTNRQQHTADGFGPRPFEFPRSRHRLEP